MGEVVGGAKAFRHLSNNLIVNVQDYGIAGGFDPQHRVGKQITGYSADDVFSPGATKSTLSVPAVLKLAGSVIGKHDVLFVFITDDARLRIGEFSTTRKC